MKRSLLVVAGLLWLVALADAAKILVTYDHTPGALIHRAPAAWPQQSTLARVEGRPTLVMLLHPKCPCSRASVAELGALLARARDAVTTHLVFHRPHGAPDDWHLTELWRTATAIPGVSVGIDRGGIESRRFGIATSGHTLLYDGAGRLQFTGGITASRGHEGDNAGRRTILALLDGRRVERHSTSVFGCSLLDHDSSGASAR